MDLNDAAKPSSATLFGIDLNDAPVPSPRETLARSAASDTHVPFSRGGRMGLLDINAMPPTEEETGEVSNSRNSSVTLMGTRFDYPMASSNLLGVVRSNEGVVPQRLFGNILKESGPSSVFSQTRAVYRAPNGSSLESMFDVARRLGLERGVNSSEPHDRNDGLVQRGSRTSQKRKETLTYSRVKNSKECQRNLNRSFGMGFASGTDTVALQACRLTISLGYTQANSKEIGILQLPQYENGFPVQFEDLSILSAGKVDLRPSYHSANQIWPVGYRSSWHDRVTGSLFVSEISDGGDSGPIFNVKRYPCSKETIPIGSTVLSRARIGLGDVKGRFGTGVAFGTNVDEDTNILLILADHIPPHLEYDTLSGTRHYLDENSSSQTMNCLQKDSSANKMRLADDIGEFLVEERSPSSVWRKVSQTLSHTCREVHKRSGVCRFYCNHDPYGTCSPSSVFQSTGESESSDSLAKFHYLSGPASILSCTRTDSELNTCCEDLIKWLDQDRFGLDVDFVREMIEQLPGVHNFADYLPLSKRSNKSTLQTVGSGFFHAKRKHDSQGEREVENSCKRPRKQGFDNALTKYCPPGKPLSTKLPKDLIGHVLQAWELLWRFSEVLGLEEPLSFQQLEEELISGYQQSFIVERGSSKEAANFNASDSSQSGSGVALTNIYCLLLKLLLGELQSTVAVSGSPKFDGGESKSRRRRKKESDSSISTKRAMLDLLPINELTWPELTRRFILTVLSIEGNHDSVEITSRGGCKMFHCLQGDRHASCDSLPRVASSMEAEALLLAEAMNQVFGSLKNADDLPSIDCHETDSLGASKTTLKVDDDEIPEWARVLEPVRKLPTNVGARIRKCVNEALEKNPPEWAKKALEHSISKEVYKGNASGPTKKAVLAVLGEVSGEIQCLENQKQKPARKKRVKGVNKISDMIMKRCRKVLRCAAVEDDDKVFCNLLGRTLLNSCDNDHKGLIGFPAMVSRPLDFRTIDLRLALGAYSGSHEAFLEDVREVWNHIRTAYSDQSEKKIELAETLSQNFESLYEKEVLSLVQKLLQYGDVETLSPEAQKELEDIVESESKMPKAPWDDGVCKVCGVDRDDDSVLLCDTCDSEYHTYCLNPPLARIPEGNWYCPSCVNGRNNQGVLQIPKVRKRRCQGELTYKFLEALTRLASTMETKEYWEYSVEEKIFLLKFLCDEVLSSTVIREHLELCTSRSTDLQQKLQSLSSEVRLLTSKDRMLADQVTSDVHLTSNGDQTKKPSCQVNQQSSKDFGPVSENPQNHLPFPISQQQNIDSSRECNASNNINRESDLEKIPEHGKCENLLSGDSSIVQPDYNLEATNLRKEIFVKQDSIADLKSKLSKVSLRKDFLGKDSGERLYWVFSGPGKSPWMVVDGATMAQHMAMVKDSPSSGSAVWNTSHQYLWRQNNDIRSHCRWFSYQSDAEVDELVGWLRDRDQKERELSESIVLWQNMRSSTSSSEAEDIIVQDGSQKTTKLMTKAMSMLEKKHGPCCCEPEAVYMSIKMSRNTDKERIYRCECLEPMWPSRNHCCNCHLSFFTVDELKEHNGVCLLGSTASHKKGKDDPQKGKGKGRTQIGHGEAGDGLVVGRVKDSACPYDIEEISVKFVIQSSIKESVQEIGLFSSNGIPSFVTVPPPYLSDPALTLQSSQDKGVARTILGSVRMGTQENVPNFMNENKELFSSRRRNSKLGCSSCYIIPDSSLRPVVGRGTRILQQLKINLLDMDAALPGDALKPSKACMEKRCAWRAFLKSAKSIFEMVQAVIAFENMIKTEYLRNEWWFWSSLSAAAKIATLSSLALRIYTLDASIIYEWTLEITELGNNSNRSESVDEDPKNSSKHTSRLVSETDATEDSSKRKGKSSRKRKTTATS